MLSTQGYFRMKTSTNTVLTSVLQARLQMHNNIWRWYIITQIIVALFSPALGTPQHSTQLRKSPKYEKESMLWHQTQYLLTRCIFIKRFCSIDCTLSWLWHLTMLFSLSDMGGQAIWNEICCLLSTPKKKKTRNWKKKNQEEKILSDNWVCSSYGILWQLMGKSLSEYHGQTF